MYLLSCATIEDKISLHIRAVRSSSPLSTWRSFVSFTFKNEASEDPDQTVWMRALIWSFAGFICTNIRFRTLPRVSSLPTMMQWSNFIHTFKWSRVLVTWYVKHTAKDPKIYNSQLVLCLRIDLLSVLTMKQIFCSDNILICHFALHCFNHEARIETYSFNEKLS